MMLVDTLDRELAMSRRTASSYFEPHLPTGNKMTSFERATREFYELALTFKSADVVGADRERLRKLLQDLLMLMGKPRIS
jgi:hypothetical protein